MLYLLLGVLEHRHLLHDTLERFVIVLGIARCVVLKLHYVEVYFVVWGINYNFLSCEKFVEANMKELNEQGQ